MITWAFGYFSHCSSSIASKVEHLLVFAQHMDALKVGRGVGSVLPEAVKAAGANGVLLNHAEKPLAFEIIQETVQRADEVGLATLVCAGDLDQAVEWLYDLEDAGYTVAR